MTIKESYTNKTLHHAILGMVAVLLICGVLCGAAAGGAWQDAINAASDGDVVKAPDDTTENITIKKNITLDLCGYTIKASDEDEPTIQIINGVQVTIKGEGVITGGNSGIWVKHGILTLDGGIVIKENKASVHGGGVCLGLVGHQAELRMKSCTISDNEGEYGAGVYVGNGCTFTMNNKLARLDKNDAGLGGYGGGVYVAQGGTFTMKVGQIVGKGTDTGNTYTVANNGAGVYVDGGEFIMEGGEITLCKADSNGGGVYVTNNGTFTMRSGSSDSAEVPSIKENYASGISDGHGGGVCVESGTFTMSDGIIGGESSKEGNNGGEKAVVYTLVRTARSL